MKRLKIFTLAEALRTQWDLQVLAGATLVANIDNSRLKSLLQIIESPAFPAPLRENRMSSSQPRPVFRWNVNRQQLSDQVSTTTANKTKSQLNVLALFAYFALLFRASCPPPLIITRRRTMCVQKCSWHFCRGLNNKFNICVYLRTIKRICVYQRSSVDNFFLWISRHGSVACTLPAAELLVAVQHRLEICKWIKRGSLCFAVVVRSIALLRLQLTLVFVIMTIDTQ